MNFKIYSPISPFNNLFSCLPGKLLYKARLKIWSNFVTKHFWKVSQVKIWILINAHTQPLSLLRFDSSTYILNRDSRYLEYGLWSDCCFWCFQRDVKTLWNYFEAVWIGRISSSQHLDLQLYFSQLFTIGKNMLFVWK